jgi:hypothetical protein
VNGFLTFVSFLLEVAFLEEKHIEGGWRGRFFCKCREGLLAQRLGHWFLGDQVVHENSAWFISNENGLLEY